MNSKSIKLIHGRPYWPQSQGAVERFNGKIGKAHKIIIGTGRNLNREQFYFHHDRFIDYHNNILKNRTTGFHPSYLLNCE